LPVRVLSRVFRSKFLAGLRAAFASGRLRLPGDVAPTPACPACGAGRLVVIAEVPAMAPARVGAGPAGRAAIFDTS
jgi:hypothetical protein